MCEEDPPTPHLHTLQQDIQTYQMMDLAQVVLASNTRHTTLAVAMATASMVHTVTARTVAMAKKLACPSYETSVLAATHGYNRPEATNKETLE